MARNFANDGLHWIFNLGTGGGWSWKNSYFNLHNASLGRHYGLAFFERKIESTSMAVCDDLLLGHCLYF